MNLFIITTRQRELLLKLQAAVDGTRYNPESQATSIAST